MIMTNNNSDNPLAPGLLCYAGGQTNYATDIKETKHDQRNRLAG